MECCYQPLSHKLPIIQFCKGLFGLFASQERERPDQQDNGCYPREKKGKESSIWNLQWFSGSVWRESQAAWSDSRATPAKDSWELLSSPERFHEKGSIGARSHNPYPCWWNCGRSKKASDIGNCIAKIVVSLKKRRVHVHYQKLSALTS